MDDEFDSSEDALELSFLDVLSCGLGAAILLFLIFSVLPHSGSGRERTARRAVAENATAPATMVGAAVDIETVNVRYATTYVRVHLHGAEWEPGDVSWVYGRREGVILVAHRVSSDELVCCLIATRGLDPRRAVRFSLRDRVTKPFQLDVAMLVGSGQKRTIKVTPSGGQWQCELGDSGSGGRDRNTFEASLNNGWRTVFAIDFLQKNAWIQKASH